MKTTILLLGIMLSISWMGYAQTIDETNEVEEDEVVGSKREKIDVRALPQAVQQGFNQSEYGNMKIIEAYMLSAEEAKKILDGTRDEKIVVEEPLLYELKVESGDHSAVLYFTEKGELYNVTDEEGIG
jgi:hypothetical protein